MRGEESGDLFLVLLRQQGACRVDKPAARLHQTRRARQDPGLQRHQIVQPLFFRRAPASIGIAPPCAGAAAWGVHQHAIETTLVALDPLIGLAGQKPGFDIVQPCPPEALGAAPSAALHVVAGDDAGRSTR